MTYQETYSDEHSDELLKNKMKKWGIKTDFDELPKGHLKPAQQEVYSLIREWLSGIRFLNYQNQPLKLSNEANLVTKVESLESSCLQLKQRIEELELRLSDKNKPTRADLIYEKYRRKLESENFGKFVAIDVNSAKIVGIGDTIIEAYQEARKNSSKETFAYRRVGFAYVHKI
jgi:hypothetical protein